MLQVGGSAVCGLTRPEQTIHASFDVELTEEHAVVTVEVSGETRQIKLKRKDRANHLHLRDFIQQAANATAAA